MEFHFAVRSILVNKKAFFSYLLVKIMGRNDHADDTKDKSVALFSRMAGCLVLM